MAAPVFIDFNPQTPINAAWLNAITQAVYVAMGNASQQPPTTAAQIIANLGLSGPSGAVNISYTQPYAGAVQQTLASNLARKVAPEDFGASVSAVDNSVALQLWLNAGAAGANLVAGVGVYNFTSPLVLGAASNLQLKGAGPYSTVFNYTGTNTTVDIISLGSNAGSQSNNLNLSGFRVSSSTKMTSGTGLHLQNMARSFLSDITIDGQDGNGNLWNGIWFDQVDVISYIGFLISSQNDGLRVNGGVGFRPKSDLFIDQGKIAPANGTTQAVGVRMGGAFGGFQIGTVDIIGNGINFTVDTSLAAESNREVTFSGLAALDSSTTGANLYLSDGGTGAVWVELTGTWVASAATQGIYVANTSASYHITITGGNLANNNSDGLQNNSLNADINIVGTKVWANKGYGINNLGGYRVEAWAPNFDVNVLGNTNGSVFTLTNTSGSVLSTNGFSVSSSPTVTWGYDSTAAVLTIANGASAAVATGSGMLLVNMQNAGSDSGAYVVGGGGTVQIGASSGGKWVASTTTPAAGKASVAYNGSNYAIYNNTGISLNVGVGMLRTNSGN